MRRPGPDAFLVSAVLAAALAWMAGCIGTETTNPHNIAPDSEPVVHGRLVDGTGNPIGGAVVKVYPSEASPLGEAAPKASAGEARAETNANGFYSFKDIPRGRYNLIGEYNGGTLVVLIPHVEYDNPDTSKDLGTDTLRLPGRIRGRTLQDGAGKGGVFCYLTGTPFLSLTDVTGEFWILGVPQGRYRLNYLSPGLQAVQDSGVVVGAGSLTAMPPVEMFPDTAFPPPLRLPPGLLD